MAVLQGQRNADRPHGCFVIIDHELASSAPAVGEAVGPPEKGPTAANIGCRTSRCGCGVSLSAGRAGEDTPYGELLMAAF